MFSTGKLSFIFMITISSYWINDNCGFLVVGCAFCPRVVLHVHPIPSSASTVARAGYQDNGESVLGYKCHRVTFSCMPMLTGNDEMFTPRRVVAVLAVRGFRGPR